MLLHPDGYGRSEAVISLVIQRKQEAQNYYAEIVAIETNSDGYKEEGITFPSLEGQSKLMDSVLAKAGIDVNQIEYVEAHMTGTSAGDMVEAEAINQSYCSNGRKKPLLIGCLKSNMGESKFGFNFNQTRKWSYRSLRGFFRIGCCNQSLPYFRNWNYSSKHSFRET